MSLQDKINELELELAILKNKLNKPKHCIHCNGKGKFLDTTYDRSGIEVTCSTCYGTGFPEEIIKQMIEETFRDYRK